jgi:hypothetical protein
MRSDIALAVTLGSAVCERTHLCCATEAHFCGWRPTALDGVRARSLDIVRGAGNRLGVSLGRRNRSEYSFLLKLVDNINCDGDAGP